MQEIGLRLGKLVRLKRSLLSWTIEDLSVASEVSRASIYELERGRTLQPRASTIQKLTHALGITMQELEPLGWDVDISPTLLPSQDPLVRIEANSDNKLELQTSFSNDDDTTTIEAYRSQFLEILAQEIDRYVQNGNRPQADQFMPRHRALISELSKPIEKINFASVYLAVNRLDIARKSAERELESPDTDWPEFYPDEKEAIDSLCVLSGPLVMASSVGRRLVTDAAIYDLNESDEAEADRLLSLYIGKVREQGIASEETEAFLDAVDIFEEFDPYPQRTRRVKFALVGSLMIVSAGAAIISVATLPTATAIGASSLAFLPYIWSKKVVENDPDFKKLVTGGGEALQKSSLKISDRSTELIRKLGDIFRKNFVQIERLGELVSEFGWVKVVVNRINSDQLQTIGRSAEYFYLLGYGESEIGKKLVGLFSGLGDHMHVHAFDISSLLGLERAIKISRAGDSLVLIWDEEAQVEDTMNRLISINRRSSLGDRNLIGLVTKKPKESSILWQYTTSQPSSISAFAPQLMAHHGFDEISLYELTLPV